MRLVCPNCGAQYEVADDLIPRAGRDVQCSACGNTWFEVPGRGAVPLPEPTPRRVTAPKAAAPEPEPEPEPEPDPEREPEPENDPEPEPERESSSEPELEPDEPVAPPPVARPAAEMRSTVTPEVAQILREEAAREAAARRAETAALETQPDLGLDNVISALVADTNSKITAAPPPPAPTPAPETLQAEEARRKMARLRGEDAPDPDPEPEEPEPEPDLPYGARPTLAPARRDVFPDIEEINSTLRSTAERAAAEAESPEAVIQTRRRGFRTGFSIIVVFALLMALVYVLAAPISAALPQFKAPLDGYVARVDAGRLWLDLRLQDLLAMMQGEAVPEAEAAPAAAPAPATGG